MAEHILRTGAKFYASFFGFRVDTSWLGKLQKNCDYAVDGLYYSSRLGIHCEMFDDGDSLGEHIAKGINKVLHEMQKPIVRKIKEVEREFNNIGKHKGYVQDMDGTSRLGQLQAVGFIIDKGLNNTSLDDEIYLFDPMPWTKDDCELASSEADRYGTIKNCTTSLNDTHFNLTRVEDEFVSDVAGVAEAEDHRWEGPTSVPPSSSGTVGS